MSRSDCKWALGGLAALLVLVAAPSRLLAHAHYSSDGHPSFGQPITIKAGETATEDSVCLGCSIHVHGIEQGDAVAIAGNVEVDGEVHGDAVAITGNVRLGPTARVDGDVVAVIGRVERDPQAKVGGEQTTLGGLPVAGLGALVLVAMLFSIVISLVLVMLCYFIAGEARVQMLAATLRQRTGTSLLAGVGVLAGVVVVVAIGFMIGHAAIPIVFVAAGILLFVIMVVGYTGLSFWLGHSLSKGIGTLVATLIGVVLLHVVQAIPLVNLLAIPAFFLLALGSAVLSGFGSAPAGGMAVAPTGTAWTQPPPPAPPGATPPAPAA